MDSIGKGRFNWNNHCNWGAIIKYTIWIGILSDTAKIDNKVEYSTIHLTIQEVKIYTAQSEDSIGTKILNGFIKNFNFLVSTVIGLIVWVLAHTPVLIILVVVGYMSIKIIKATKRRIQIKSKKNKQQQKKSDTNEKDT